MNQTNLKKLLSVVAAFVAIALAAHAAGQIEMSKAVAGWLGVVATTLGVFGASPIGRVLGMKETITRVDGTDA